MDSNAIKRGEEHIEQWGVKGMRWGVRRSREERRAARNQRKAVEKQAHEDKKRAQNLLKKKTKDLSNDDLRFLNERLQLEAKFKQLNPKGRVAIEKKVAAALVTAGLYKKSYEIVKSQAGQDAILTGMQKMSSPAGRKLLGKLVTGAATSPYALAP